MPVTSSPPVASTVGLKNLVIAPLLTDTETAHTYGPLQRIEGVIDASVSPDNADPDIQYADDIEFHALYPDPELTSTTKSADIPLLIQEKIFGNHIDNNGVLVRGAADEPPYFAIGFASEKANRKMRYVWLYKVRARPMTENYATKAGKTITRQTGDIQWTAIKRTHDGLYQVVADEGENGFDSTKAKTFLETVYTPSITPKP